MKAFTFAEYLGILFAGVMAPIWLYFIYQETGLAMTSFSGLLMLGNVIRSYKGRAT